MICPLCTKDLGSARGGTRWRLLFDHTQKEHMPQYDFHCGRENTCPLCGDKFRSLNQTITHLANRRLCLSPADHRRFLVTKALSS